MSQIFRENKGIKRVLMFLLVVVIAAKGHLRKEICANALYLESVRAVSKRSPIPSPWLYKLWCTGNISSPEEAFALGTWAYYVEGSENAIGLFEISYSSGYRSLLSGYWLALALYETGDHHRAGEIWRTIGVASKVAQRLRWQAYYALSQGENAQAQELLEHAVAIAPSLSLYEDLADFYLYYSEPRQPEKAALVFEKIAAVSNEPAVRAYALGRAALIMGKGDEAIAWFNKAVLADSLNPSYWYFLGLGFLAKQDVISAKRVLKQAYFLSERDGSIFSLWASVMLGDISAQHQQWAEAVFWYCNAVKDSRASPEVWRKAVMACGYFQPLKVMLPLCCKGLGVQSSK